MDFIKFLINLDERTDRLQESIVELQKVGFNDVIRFPAIKTPQHGMFGCFLSHLYVLGEAKKQKKHVMILEDDVKFLDGFNDILNLALIDLENIDWHMFYLGGNICGPMYPVTKNLAKLTWAQSTHAYCVNYNFIDTLFVNLPLYYGTPLDMIYATKIIPNANCYITLPKMIAVQRKSFSDIEQGVVEYESWMPKRYDQNLVKN